MKYLFFLLLITGLSCSAQDYQVDIAKFRQQYMDDFLSDKNSPLKKDDLTLLRFYDADSTYRVNATVELLLNQSGFIMPVYSGTGREYVKYAVLKFTLKGKPMQLSLYKSVSLSKLPQYKDYLFLPFADDTNGNATYGGGRYIDMSTGDIKGNTAVVDFNKAYNPYCAFAAGYSCPKPPDENRLDAAIKAGEKKYAGATTH